MRESITALFLLGLSWAALAADPITYITPTDITPTADETFKTVDLSAYIPSGSSGVLVEVHYPNATSNDSVGFRQTGSTDVYYSQKGVYPEYTYVAMGVDASRQLDVALDGTTYTPTVNLLAYFDPASVKFFENAVTFEPTASAWTDADIASATGTDTATAAILLIDTDRASQTEIGWRVNGGTDHRGDDGGAFGGFYHGTAIVPVDGSEIFELWRNSANYGSFKVVGYTIANYTAVEPPTEITPGTASSFQDVDTGVTALATMINVWNTTAALTIGVRPDGASNLQSAYEVNREIGTYIMPGDQIDVYVSNTTEANVYLSGYFTAEVIGGGELLLRRRRD